jgi:hypothetical protein
MARRTRPPKPGSDARNDELMKTFTETVSFDQPMDESTALATPTGSDEPEEDIVAGGDPQDEEPVGMTEDEIKQKGWQIDLPFESGSPNPHDIEYGESDDPSTQYDSTKYMDWDPKKILNDLREPESKE